MTTQTCKPPPRSAVHQHKVRLKGGTSLTRLASFVLLITLGQCLCSTYSPVPSTLETKTYYLTSESPPTQTWSYPLPLFTFADLAKQAECKPVTYQTVEPTQPYVITVGPTDLTLKPTYSNAAMAVGTTLTNAFKATFADGSSLRSSDFTVIIQDNCRDPVTSPLPTTNYKLILSTINQSWSFTKFTFPSAFMQSNCYDSLTYSSPDGYTVSQGAGTDQITLTPTYNTASLMWTTLTHTLKANYADSSLAASITFQVDVTDYCWPVVAQTTVPETQPTIYSLKVGVVTQSWTYSKFKPSNDPASTNCYNAMTYTTTPSQYTINQGTGTSSVTLTPTYSALTNIGQTYDVVLVATLKSDATKVATTSFKVQVIDYCWPVVAQTTVTQTQPTIYSLKVGVVTQSWTYSKFKPSNDPASTNCYNAMTYTTTPSQYTINQGTGTSSVTLTPTYSALTNIGQTYDVVLVATLKSDATKVATTSFKVQVIDYCWPVVSQTTVPETQPTIYSLQVGVVTQSWPYSKFKPSNDPASLNCYDAMTYTTTPSQYTINQGTGTSSVTLTPTYSALTDIGQTYNVVLVATLKSDATKVATTQFQVQVQNWCQTQTVSFPTTCNSQTFVITIPDGNAIAYPLVLDPTNVASSQAAQCNSWLSYSITPQVPTQGDATWVTVDAVTAAITDSVPAGQSLWPYQITWFNLQVTNSVDITKFAVCKITFKYQSTICTSDTPVITKISTYSDEIYYPYLYAWPYPVVTKLFSSMFTLSYSANTACNSFYLEPTGTWAGITYWPTANTGGINVSLVSMCTNVNYPTCQSITVPTPISFQFDVINSSGVKTASSVKIYLTKPCSAPVFTFNWPATTLTQNAVETIYTDAISNAWSVTGGDYCGSTTPNYYWSDLLTNSVPPTQGTGPTNDWQSAGVSQISKNVATSTYSGMVSTGTNTVESVGSDKFTIALTDNAKVGHYITIQFCVTFDMRISGGSSTTSCNPTYFRVLVQPPCWERVPTCPTTGPNWPLATPTANLPTGYFVYEIKDCIGGTSAAACIKSYVIPLCTVPNTPLSTCSIQSQAFYEDAACSSFTSKTTPTAVLTYPASLIDTSDQYRTLKIATNLNSNAGDYSFCYQVTNNGGRNAFTASQTRISVRIVQDCSNVVAPITLTTPADIHLTYQIGLVAPPTKTETALLNYGGADINLCPLQYLSQNILGTPLPPGSWSIYNNTLATNYIFGVSLDNFWADGTTPVGTLSVAEFPAAEYVIQRTQTTKDAYAPGTQKIYLYVAPDCSKLVLTWPTAQPNVAYTVYSGPQAQTLRMFSRNLNTCKVTSVEMQIQIAGTWTTLATFSLASTIVDKYTLSYAQSGTTNLLLTTQPQNAWGYNTVTGENFNTYPGRMLANPQVASGTIAVNSFNFVLSQTCNKAVTDSNGQAISITPPAAVSETVQVDTAYSFLLPNFSTNEPSCILSYTFTLVSQPSPNGAASTIFVATALTGTTNAFSIQFMHLVAVNINSGLYTYNFCARNFQTTTPVCQTVTILVKANCKTESVIFTPFSVSYRVATTLIDLNLQPQPPMRSSLPVDCPISKILLSVTQAGVTTQLPSASFPQFAFTPYTYTDTSSGHLRVFTTDNTKALIGSSYTFEAAVLLQYVPDEPIYYKTSNPLITMFIHPDCRASNGVVITNAIFPTVIYSNRYFVNFPVQSSAWSAAPTITAGCPPSFSMTNAGALLTNADGSQIVASSIYSIVPATGVFSVSTSIDSFAGPSQTQATYPALININTYNATIASVPVSVTVYSRCYGYQVSATPSTTYDYFYYLNDDITNPLAPVLIPVDFPLPTLSFSFNGVAAAFNYALCGQPWYTLNRIANPISPTYYDFYSLVTTSPTTSFLRVGTQNILTYGQYFFQLIVDIGLNTSNLYLTSNPNGFTQANLSLTLNVKDVCSTALTLPPQLVAHDYLWTTSVLATPLPVIIAEVGQGGLDKASIDRFCGVLLYTITWPPEYNNFAGSNVPLTGQTFNFNIDAKSNDAVGKFPFFVSAKYSKPNYLNITLNYTFYVQISPCRIMSKAINSLALKPIYDYLLLDPPFNEQFAAVQFTPACPYEVALSFTQLSPGYKDSIVYPFAFLSHPNQDLNYLTLVSQNENQFPGSYVVQIRSDLKNYPYNTTFDLEFVTSLYPPITINILKASASAVKNTAPFFTNLIKTLVAVPESVTTYTLPELLDKENDSRFVSEIKIYNQDNNAVTLPWAQFDVSAVPILLSFNPPIQSSGKQYTVMISVQDQNENPMQTSYSFILQVAAEQVFKFEGFVKSAKTNETMPSPTVKITAPTSKGRFQLIFDQVMRFPFPKTSEQRKLEVKTNLDNLSGEINSTNVGELLFQIDWVQSPSIVAPKGNNFTQNTIFNWTIVHVDSYSIEFQLRFENLYDISKYQKDTMVFTMLQCDLFEAIESGKPPANCTGDTGAANSTNKVQSFKTKVPKQVSEAAQDTQTYAANLNIGLKSIFSTNLVLCLFVAGSLQSMWRVVNALQVVVFTVLFNLNFPENVNSSFSQLITLLSFDVFQAEVILEAIFNFQDVPPFSQRFSEVGYESSNFISNMGSTFIIWILIILFAGLGEIFVRILEHCGNHHKFVRTIIKKFQAVNKKQVFLTQLFETHMDTCINTVICCYMFAQNPSLYFVNVTEGVSIMFAFFFAVVNAIFLPIYLLNAAVKFKASISKNKEVFLQYVDIFDKVRHRSFGTLVYDLVFILRRLALVIAFTTGKNYPVAQVMFNNFLSLACCCYIAHNKPLKKPFDNRIEIFNEFMNLIFCFHLYVFTEWISDSNAQIITGFVMLVIIGLQSAVNIFFIAKEQVQAFIKKYRIYLYKKAEKKIRQAQAQRLLEKAKLDALALQREIERKTLEQLFGVHSKSFVSSVAGLSPIPELSESSQCKYSKPNKVAVLSSHQENVPVKTKQFNPRTKQPLRKVSPMNMQEDLDDEMYDENGVRVYFTNQSMQNQNSRNFRFTDTPTENHDNVTYVLRGLGTGLSDAATNFVRSQRVNHLVQEGQIAKSFFDLDTQVPANSGVGLWTESLQKRAELFQQQLKFSQRKAMNLDQ